MNSTFCYPSLEDNDKYVKSQTFDASLIAVFEATHGSAPRHAGLDKANPGSLILSATMMLRYLGWNEAAELCDKALRKTILAKTVTYDLERLMNDATLVSTSKFGELMVKNMLNE